MWYVTWTEDRVIFTLQELCILFGYITPCIKVIRVAVWEVHLDLIDDDDDDDDDEDDELSLLYGWPTKGF